MAAMARVHLPKMDYPVSKVRRYLEPGPVVLITSRWKGETNVMTLGWQTVMEFSPSLVGCVISRANHSFGLVRASGECVINLPTTALIDAVIGIGNTTGTDTDKFKAFGLTAVDGVEVSAPLIAECHANFECRLHDDAMVESYDFFVFEVVKAHVAPVPEHPKTLHYMGDGRFMTAGPVIDRQAQFTRCL